MIEALWTFCNSPVGVALVSGVVLTVLGHLFKSRPAWEELYDTYRADLFSAVRFAEENIPDDTPNKALARLDAALRFISTLETPLARKKEKDVRKALTRAHDEMKG